MSALGQCVPTTSSYIYLEQLALLLFRMGFKNQGRVSLAQDVLLPNVWRKARLECSGLPALERWAANQLQLGQGGQIDWNALPPQLNRSGRLVRQALQRPCIKLPAAGALIHHPSLISPTRAPAVLLGEHPSLPFQGLPQ